MIHSSPGLFLFLAIPNRKTNSTMEPTTYPIFYVTSKGSLKSARGLLHPGDVYPTEGRTDKQLQILFDQGKIGTDPAEAFTVQDAPEQKPLPMSEAGTDDETVPPAKVGQSQTNAARQALRVAQAKDKEAVEVLGAGPVRRVNDEILPVAETDPSNVTLADAPAPKTLADLKGQNISVEDLSNLKR